MRIGSNGACAVLLCSLLGACAPTVIVAPPCERNSDCEEPLACVDGRCGSECVLHADCSLAARCVLVAEGVGRCFIDAAAQCDVDEPCPYEGLECVGRRCYSPCSASCPSDTVCIDDLCRRPEDSDAGSPDA